MDKLQDIIAKITPLDDNIMTKVQTRLDTLTKPIGSLGALESLAKQFVGARKTLTPAAPHKAIVLMAADHGVAIENVSAYPQEVTEQMIYNFCSGGAAINVLAKHTNADLILVDVGVTAELPAHLPILHRKVRHGTNNIRCGAAMSETDVMQAIHIGVDIANSLIDNGIQVIGLGEMGIGNTTVSSAIASVLMDKSPSEVTGVGTGLDDKLLAHKVNVVSEAIAINNPNANDVIDVLTKVGGLEIASLTGVILAGACRNVLIIIDGFIASTAALAAYRLCPDVKDYFIAAHLSPEPGHNVILQELSLTPLLHLQMRLGEGTGAALGMTMLDASLKILNEMATFDEAKVASALTD